MGDMGDIFREMTAYKKEKKEKRLSTFNPSGWRKLSPYHFRKMVNGEKLDYWPSTTRFRYKNRTHFGNVDKFIENRRGENQ